LKIHQQYKPKSIKPKLIEPITKNFRAFLIVGASQGYNYLFNPAASKKHMIAPTAA